ncbi:MAG TPA: hypothetical protein VLF63_02230 [Patescibacteria group bacterium]|nr:hypothetical protein [Patescibacteria group bacterium]
MKFKSLVKHYKNHLILSSIVTFISIIILIFWLHFPALRNAGNSNGFKCSRSHIYIPRRLDYFGCKTIIGTVKFAKIEPDGDSHVLLDLDQQYKVLLTEQNYNRQQGYMVIEDTCHRKPKEILAKLICHHYRSSLPDPVVGKRYEITGNYVVDDWHGSWAEIHGLSELKLLN